MDYRKKAQQCAHEYEKATAAFERSFKAAARYHARATKLGKKLTRLEAKALAQEEFDSSEGFVTGAPHPKERG